MWYQNELKDYPNETRAALALFLPYPGGMSARAFDQAARAGKLTGPALAWENTLLEACRLLALSTPSGAFADVLRHARKVAAEADGRKGCALDRLDPTLRSARAKYIRDDRARRSLRRAFMLPPASGAVRRASGAGAGAQRQRQSGNAGLVRS